jgi:hypothetical protein
MKKIIMMIGIILCSIIGVFGGVINDTTNEGINFISSIGLSFNGNDNYICKQIYISSTSNLQEKIDELYALGYTQINLLPEVYNLNQLLIIIRIYLFINISKKSL